MILNLYQSSPYKDIIHTIDSVVIPFDTGWRNIGISLSGGADSALLTYLLCTIIEKHNSNTIVHILSNVRGWKTKPWQRFDSINVYNYLVKLFPNINFKRHENFIPPELEWGSIGPTLIDEYGKQSSGDVIEIRAFAEFVGHWESLDAYYNAVTKNPPIELSNSMPHRDVDVSPETFHLAITKHMNGLACHPFRFVDKGWIMLQYKNYNLELLLDITRSCEGEFEKLDYRTYTPGQYVPVCNQCFWCLEREWAIEQNK